jgi:uncharacterized membrane protein YhaH (DUF805 family)
MINAMRTLQEARPIKGGDSMTTVPLIFQPLVRYADFNGRSRRSEFWLWVLFRIILGCVLASGMMAIVVNSLPQLESNPEIFLRNYFIASPLLTLVNLGLLIPTLAVGVRRLHDINRSGWWIILPYVVAFVGVIAFLIFFGTSLVQLFSENPEGDLSEADAIQLVLSSLSSLLLCIVVPSLITWVVMLIFYVSEGTIGPNRFGPDPKARAEAPSAPAMHANDAPEEMY